MRDAPEEIFLHPDDPDFSCVNGDGKIKYTRTDTIPEWSTDMDAAPYETPVFTCWMGNEKRKPVVLVNFKNSGVHLGKKDNWWHSRPDQQPNRWRHIDLPSGASNG